MKYQEIANLSAGMIEQKRWVSFVPLFKAEFLYSTDIRFYEKMNVHLHGEWKGILRMDVSLDREHWFSPSAGPLFLLKNGMYVYDFPKDVLYLRIVFVQHISGTVYGSVEVYT